VDAFKGGFMCVAFCKNIGNPYYMINASNPCIYSFLPIEILGQSSEDESKEFTKMIFAYSYVVVFI